MKNRVLTVITVILICSAFGFLIAKTYHSSKVIEGLSRQISINQDERQADLDRVLAQAELFIQQGDLSKAELYLSNGIHHNPGNWELLKRYYDTIVSHMQEIQRSGNGKQALGLLSEIELFIKTQSLYLQAHDLERLEKLLLDLQSTQQQLVRNVETEHSRAILMTVKQWREKPQPLDNQDGLPTFLDTLQNNLLALNALDTSLLDAEEITTEISDAQVFLEAEIAKIEKAISSKNMMESVDMITLRAKGLMEKILDEPVESELIAYYLASAESLIGQVVLLSSEVPPIKHDALELISELKKTKIRLEDRQSSAVWKDIKLVFQQTQEQDGKPVNVRLQALVTFKEFFINQARKLSSSFFISEARELAMKLDRSILELQQEQQTLYNEWAISTIGKFYRAYKDELGIGTNEENIYRAMIGSLGIIDTRYISIPVQTAYSEVFNKFYAELEDHQKILVSSEITLKKKKLLSDF